MRRESMRQPVYSNESISTWGLIRSVEDENLYFELTNTQTVKHIKGLSVTKS